MILIDTDVMVDVLRQYSPAVAWLDALRRTYLQTSQHAIPGKDESR